MKIRIEALLLVIALAGCRNPYARSGYIRGPKLDPPPDLPVEWNFRDKHGRKPNNCFTSANGAYWLCWTVRMEGTK